MKKFISSIIITMIATALCLFGCNNAETSTDATQATPKTPDVQNETNETPPATFGENTEAHTEEPTADLIELFPSDDIRRLTEDELATFEKYFNREEGKNRNARNTFLHEYFTCPHMIDLSVAFYEGTDATDTVSDTERATASGDPNLSTVKITASEMRDLFMQYTGVELDATEKNGIDSFTYLEEYDAYYLTHSDTRYSDYDFYDGWIISDSRVVLIYDSPNSSVFNGVFYQNHTSAVTLKKVDNEYILMSNLPFS